MLVTTLVVASGCNFVSEDPKTVAIRDQIVSRVPIEGAITLTELAKSIAAIESSDVEVESVRVTLVGRIFAGALEPWEPGKASFVLSELPAEGHGEGHDADNCPFCKRRAAKAPHGIVKFVDEKNEILSIDARKLLGVAKDDRVTVRGTAIADQFGSLVVTADQIYIAK